MELLFRYLLFLLVKHWVQIGFPQTLMIPGDFLLIHKVRQAMIMLSTSCESSKQWLMKMQMDKTYILIYDGHGSHVRGQFLDHCLQNKIHPLYSFHACAFTAATQCWYFWSCQKGHAKLTWLDCADSNSQDTKARIHWILL